MKGQLPWGILANPVSVIGIVVSLVILNLPIIPVELAETYYESSTISYEITSEAKLVNTTKFLVFHDTKAKISIKNTDNVKGNFAVNFVFSQDGQRITKTESTEILPGEEKIIETHAPSQELTETNIIVPTKLVPVQKIVSKTITAWQFITHSY
ncbi:MAG: hypothetical protein HYS80_01905 [Candidatus Aenigmarchaeota archaeon]|nr:hypothetical protein [Candidatus Aenigmarchaeota archaeon]